MKLFLWPSERMKKIFKVILKFWIRRAPPILTRLLYQSIVRIPSEICSIIETPMRWITEQRQIFLSILFRERKRTEPNWTETARFGSSRTNPNSNRHFKNSVEPNRTRTHFLKIQPNPNRIFKNSVEPNRTEPNSNRKSSVRFALWYFSCV